MTYTIKYGNTITDAVINSTGDILNWPAFLDANNFDSWTPALFAGDSLNVTGTLQPLVLSEVALYPANNGLNADITEQINEVFRILAGAMSGSAPVIAPKVVDTNTYYTIRYGETITDGVINPTGNINNWSDILDANGLDTWTPRLTAGQKVAIPVGSTDDLNAFRAMVAYPANNGLTDDIISQINSIFSLLSCDWILRYGFWRDGGIWCDNQRWIDSL